MAKCPKCNSQIDDDSLYCDQCGTLLYICSACHKIGKGEGKRCGNCGQQLVPATMKHQQILSEPSQPQQPPVQQAPVQQAPVQQMPQRPQATITNRQVGFGPQGTILPSAENSIAPISLKSTDYSITLQLVDEALIGRDYSSPYAQLLHGFSSMSRKHAKLIKNGNLWYIMDIGSSFGTSVNGLKCAPNQQYNIKVGDIIVFSGIYNFYVI